LSASDSTFAAPDRITDFHRGDTIDLAGIDADSTVDGNQAFAFIEGAFTGAGQLRATFDAGTKLWSVEGDTDGDAMPTS
jgi:hypothetical protein